MGTKAPRTWNPSETITSYFFNQDVRDQFFALDTNRIHGVGYGGDTGMQKVLVSGIGMNPSGQANTSVSVWDRMTSYDVLIPGNSLTQPGDCVTVQTFWAQVSTAGNHSMGISLGPAGAKRTVAYDAGSAAYYWSTTTWIRRRTATTAALTGIGIGSSSNMSASTTTWLVNYGETFDWSTDLVLCFWCYGPASGTTSIRDCHVQLQLGLIGSIPS